MVTGIYTEDDGDMTSAMTQQTGQGHRSSVRGLDPTSSERVDDGASRSVRPTQRLTSQISQDRINSGQSTIDGAIRGSFVSSHQQTVASGETININNPLLKCFFFTSIKGHAAIHRNL